RRAGAAPGEDQMVGKEMDKRTQQPTERAVWETLAAETAYKAACTQFTGMIGVLMHDRSTLLPMRTMLATQPHRAPGRGGGPDTTGNSESRQRVQLTVNEPRRFCTVTTGRIQRRFESYLIDGSCVVAGCQFVIRCAAATPHLGARWARRGRGFADRAA